MYFVQVKLWCVDWRLRSHPSFPVTSETTYEQRGASGIKNKKLLCLRGKIWIPHKKNSNCLRDIEGIDYIEHLINHKRSHSTNGVSNKITSVTPQIASRSSRSYRTSLSKLCACHTDMKLVNATAYTTALHATNGITPSYTGKSQYIRHRRFLMLEM